MKHYVPLTRNAKLGRAGKLLRCATCNSIGRRVYSLFWKKMPCIVCQKEIDKYDWLIEETLY